MSQVIEYIPAADECLYEHPYRVFDGVIALRASNPTSMSFEGTNTWILHAEGAALCTVIDPATPVPCHLDAIESVAAVLGAKVGAIVLTHEHPDHTGGAFELSERTGAPVLARKFSTVPERGPFVPHEGAMTLKALSLPGHSGDSVGFLLPQYKALISGDTFFSRGWTAVLHPDGSLADYFATLQFVRDLIESGKVEHVLPGHREIMDAPDALVRIGEYEEHRRMRLARVADAIRNGGPCEVEEILRVAYPTITDPELRWAARMNIMAQLRYLEDNGSIDPVSDAVRDAEIAAALAAAPDAANAARFLAGLKKAR